MNFDMKCQVPTVCGTSYHSYLMSQGHHHFSGTGDRWPSMAKCWFAGCTDMEQPTTNFTCVIQSTNACVQNMFHHTLLIINMFPSLLRSS